MSIRSNRTSVRALLARHAQPGLDFPRAHRDHAVLWQFGLNGVNLCAAQLPEAVARGIQLSGAYLGFITLFRADLGAASVRAGDLGYAHLQCANPIGADLLVTDLHGAALEEASLQGARLVAVVCDRGPT
jgi:uncharacterized protein YjbI with pentapeptide repeats